MSPVRVLARPLLASSFVYSGIERLTKPQALANKLSASLDRLATKFPQLRPLADRPETAARALGGLQIAAGVFYALGRNPRLSAAALVLTSLIGAADDYAGSTMTEKIKTASLSGGVLLAAVDTNGAPSVAWRAEHLSRAARKDLARARREAAKSVRRGIEHANKTAEELLDR